MIEAGSLRKPRWMLAHANVVFARRLLRDLGYGTAEERATLHLGKGAKSLTDLRVIDMYEAAIRDGDPLSERVGNWVQEFETDADALVFTTAQFSRFQEVERFIETNMSRPEEVVARVKGLLQGEET